MAETQLSLKSAANRPRSMVYIDGFNLYNGSIKGTPHKWLDIQAFFEKLRQHENVVKIHYFTAKMAGDSGIRQQVYLNALETLPKVSVVIGRYKTKTVKCRVNGCTFSGSKKFEAWEEKRTDVNIALQILDDAYQDVTDHLVVVSGDSDLVPALHRVKDRFPQKKLIVYIPARDDARGAAVEMRTAADKDATLPLAMLKVCQLPNKIADGSGGWIVKPVGW